MIHIDSVNKYGRLHNYLPQRIKTTCMMHKFRFPKQKYRVGQWKMLINKKIYSAMSSIFIISAQCSLPDLTQCLEYWYQKPFIFIFRLWTPIDYTPWTHKQRTQKVQETLHNLQLSFDWPILIMIKRQQYICSHISKSY